MTKETAVLIILGVIWGSNLFGLLYSVVVLKTKTFGEILYRQIAGALARRIVNYAKVGANAIQGEDAGFIKFGSRVDLFLPLDSKVKVKLNQKVIGGETVISN